MRQRTDGRVVGGDPMMAAVLRRLYCTAARSTMATIDQRRRDYVDVLILMSERTSATIEALRRPAGPWRVYEGMDGEKEVTQELLQDLLRQQADFEYLIKADNQK